MEHKAFPAVNLKIDEDTREVVGIASVFGVIDSYNDNMHKGSFTRTLEQRSERVKHLWQHDMYMPPIATISELREVGRAELPDQVKKKYPEAKGGLLVGRRYLDTERGNEVFTGLKAGAITEMSFAFDPLKYDYDTEKDEEGGEMLIRHVREVRLWETSDVLWGANPATVAAAKSAMPFKDTGLAEDGTQWQDPGELALFADGEWDELSEAQQQRIEAHFAIGKNAKRFEELLLPHHQPSKSGVGAAVWTGVSQAMSLLLFTSAIRGADRRAAYEHLAKHYEQFDKEPPALKQVELAWSLGDALLKAQAVDTPEIIQSLKTLQSALRPDPPDPKQDPSLTLRLAQEALMRRKARLQREIS